MPSFQDNFSDLSTTQAWRFAGLVQERLTHPVDEEVITVPESPTPGPRIGTVGCLSMWRPTALRSG
jgi:hypothetical protein